MAMIDGIHPVSLSVLSGDETAAIVHTTEGGAGRPSLAPLAHVYVGPLSMCMSLAQAVELRDQLSAAIAEHEQKQVAAAAAS